MTLDGYVKNKKEILEAVEKMLKEVKEGKLRLLGVRCTNLIAEETFRKNSLENFLIRTVAKKEQRKETVAGNTGMTARIKEAEKS